MTDHKKILSIGIDPHLIDFSSPEFAAFPGMTAEKVAAGIDGSINQLNTLGYDAEKCWIDFGKTAISVVEEKLRNNTYDCIMIGAGIRKAEANFILFEKLVNIIHEMAPHSKICFNTKPNDTIEAIQRWA